jgi:2-keto-4-pentenoate hydratase/2-oxohepta-3-ene-1,7-dioic acid hydratase in catechol pathway
VAGRAAGVAPPAAARPRPGDLILTGTPQGVALSGRFPYLRAGDVVELDIEGLGTQRQTFVPA